MLAYYESRSWKVVRSADVNEYLQELCGDDVSAKDFRTGRRRAQTRAIKEVAEYLGNTPAVCRSAYVGPAVIEAFEQGETIWPVLDGL